MFRKNETAKIVFLQNQGPRRSPKLTFGVAGKTLTGGGPYKNHLFSTRCKFTHKITPKTPPRFLQSGKLGGVFG